MVVDQLIAAIESADVGERWLNRFAQHYYDLYLRYEADDDDVDEAVVEADALAEFDVARDELISQLRKEAESDGSGDLIVYRCVQVDDVDDFIDSIVSSSRPLGIYWTWRSDYAFAYWGKRSRNVVVKAAVALPSINITETVLVNTSPHTGTLSGSEEREIRLNASAPVRVLSVLTVDGVVLKSFGRRTRQSKAAI